MFINRQKINTAINRLANSLQQTNIANHPFYQYWLSTTLNDKQLIIFSLNYEIYNHSLTENIDPLLQLFRKKTLTADDFNLIVNQNNQNRIKLLKNVFDTLLSQIKHQNITLCSFPRHFISTASYDLLTKRHKLLTQYSLEFSSGVLLAQSWIHYIQALKLYCGIWHYQCYFTLPDFHKLCQKFYLHLHLDNQAPQQNVLLLLNHIIRNEKQLSLCKQGVNQYLELLTLFWNSVYKKIIACDLNKKITFSNQPFNNNQKEENHLTAITIGEQHE